MDGATIYRWTGILPGREGEAVDFIKEANAFFDALLAEGRVTSYDWYLSMERIGFGYIVVTGDMKHLLQNDADPAVTRLRTHAALLLSAFEWGHFVTGGAFAPVVDRFQQVLAHMT